MTPATPLVSEGDEVEYEQKIGEPADKGFSIGVWASVGGEVSSIDGSVVAISGSAVDEEDAEVREEAKAQAGASSAGGAAPRGEGESFEKTEAGTGRR